MSEEQYGPLPIVRGMFNNNLNSPKDLTTPTAENVSRFALKHKLLVLLMIDYI
jgi:hypothetical protein